MKGFFKKQKKYQSTKWVEESFSFEVSQGKQVMVPQSDEFFGKSIRNRTILYLFLAFLFVFFLLWARLVHIQIVRGAEYKDRAEANRERILSIPSERGIVYDRNKIPLTQNIPNFSLAISPQDLPYDQNELDRIAKRLSDLTGTSKEEIFEKLIDFRSNKNKYRSLVIQENLEYEAALLFQIDASDLPGVHIERGSKRLYYTNFDASVPAVPVGEVTSSLEMAPTSSESHSLSHVIGYLGKVNSEELAALEGQGYLLSDSLGKNGVEKTYESFLRGEYGKRRVEVDTSGRQQVVLAEEVPKPGKHLILSLDIHIQQKLEEALQQTIDQFEKQKGSAVALDPNTGEILALVSLPAFDNNDFSGGIKTEVYKKYTENPNFPLFNRVTSGMYPSGSTIKPAIAAAALQEGNITKNTTVLSNGGVRIGQWFFPDWQGGGHGTTDVRKSLAESVNTFYYAIGGGFSTIEGLGIEKIVSYLKKFGLSEPLGVDIPAEQSGFLPSKEWKEETKGEPWYIGDTYNLSIGQGDLLVTPLQIANMTATVANGGTVFRPHIAHAIMDPFTKEEEPMEPTVLRSNFIDPIHFSTIASGMRDCVISGSCRRLASVPVNVAGKTGTAQWNSNRDNHAWFTSFAPFEKPEIVVTIMIEEGEEGSRTAVPVADTFFRWWATYRTP